MTYKFQRNIPMHIPAIIFTFLSFGIFTIGFCCGKMCESTKIKKEKERQILVQKEINRIA